MRKNLVIILAIVVFAFLVLFLFKSNFLVFAQQKFALSDERVSPSWTWPGGQITFEVDFFDSKNRTPDEVLVYIDKKFYQMTQIEKRGEKIRYQYKWSPTADDLGSHIYWFEAKINSEKARLPNFEGGTYGGPYVFTSKEPFKDFQVILFQKDKEIPVWTYGPNSLVRTLSFSQDGKYLAVGAGRKVILFDTSKSEPLWEYELGISVRSVSISADGNYLIAGAFDGKIGFFEKSKGKPLWTYQATSGILDTSISDDGQYMSVGTNKLYVFERKSGEPIWVYQGKEGGFFSVPISQDGNYIGAGHGNSLSLFERKSETPLWTFQGEGIFESIVIASDASYLAGGTHCPDRKMFVFKKTSNIPVWQRVVHDEAPPFVVTASSDLSSIAVAIDGASENYSNFYLFTKDDNKPLWEYKYGNHPFNASAVSADGKYIVGGAGDGSVFLWDAKSNKPLWQAKTNRVIGSAAISGNGEFLAVGHSLPYQWFLEEEIPQSKEIEQEEKTEEIGKEPEEEIEKKGQEEGFLERGTPFYYLIFSGVIFILSIVLGLLKRLKKWLIIILVILFLGGILGFIFTTKLIEKEPIEEESTIQEGPILEAPECGDGLCEPDKGEDSRNCPSDCKGSPIE